MNTGDPFKDNLSQARLDGVHPKLLKLFNHVASTSTTSFFITEGLRTLERQKMLVAKGASRTLKSKHLTGHAVDIAIMLGDELRWDWPLYRNFSEEVKASALVLGIKITWGGDWPKFRDGPHYELKLNPKTGEPL